MRPIKTTNAGIQKAIYINRRSTAQNRRDYHFDTLEGKCVKASERSRTALKNATESTPFLRMADKESGRIDIDIWACTAAVILK